MSDPAAVCSSRLLLHSSRLRSMSSSNLRKPLLHRFHNLLMGGLNQSCGVDHDHAMCFALRDLCISIRYASIKFPVFALEAVLVLLLGFDLLLIATARACKTRFQTELQKNG